MSYEKLNRNREIKRLKLAGASYKEIAHEFGMSETRVRQIIQQVTKDDADQSHYVLEIEKACIELNAPAYLNNRIQNCLQRMKLNKLNRWRKLTHNDILSIRSLGEKAAEVIEYAQKIKEK